MRWRPVAVFAVGISLVGPTLVGNRWIDLHLAPRFALLLGLAAVGLPYLVVLALPGPPRVETVRRPVRPRTRQHERPRPKARSANGRQQGQRTATARATASVSASEVAPAVSNLVRWTARFGLAFCVWGLLSSILSPHPALALFGLYISGNGELMVLAIAGAWAVGCVAGAGARQTIEWALLTAVGINTIVALAQGVSGAGRTTGAFNNPVYLAGLLSGGLWLIIRRFSGDWRVWGAAAAAVAAAIQMSGSRSSIVLMPVVAVAAGRVLPFRRAVLVATFLAGGLLLGGLLFTVGGGSSATSRVAGETSGFRSRLEAWSEAGHALARRPVLGEGPGRFQEATAPFRTLRFAKAEGPDSTFGDAHNLVVEYAVTTGLVGAALFLAFGGCGVLAAGWRSPLGGFAVFAILGQFLEPQAASLTPIAFLALGAAAAGEAPVKAMLPPGARGALVGAAALMGLLITVGSYRATKVYASLSAASSGMRTARALLPFWYVADNRTASIYHGRADSDPAARAEYLMWLTKAAQKEPDQFEFWFELGAAEARYGEYAAAETDFGRALKLNRWSVNTLDDLAEVEHLLNHPNQASVYARRSLVVNPNQPDVRSLAVPG